jgi:hypothetical protein
MGPLLTGLRRPDVGPRLFRQGIRHESPFLGMHEADVEVPMDRVRTLRDPGGGRPGSRTETGRRQTDRAGGSVVRHTATASVTEEPLVDVRTAFHLGDDLDVDVGTVLMTGPHKFRKGRIHEVLRGLDDEGYRGSGGRRDDRTFSVRTHLGEVLQGPKRDLGQMRRTHTDTERIGRWGCQKDDRSRIDTALPLGISAVGQDGDVGSERDPSYAMADDGPPFGFFGFGSEETETVES